MAADGLHDDPKPRAKADDEAFKRELVQLIPHLRAFARTLCGDPAAADDLRLSSVGRCSIMSSALRCRGGRPLCASSSALNARLRPKFPHRRDQDGENPPLREPVPLRGVLPP